MTLTFAETHNMIAYLTKSDTSEGFNQIINFLNGSSIKYALTVNLNIYVSCIKQFWTNVAVKKVNGITKLQALVDKKKVVVTEATIRDALHFDDTEGVKCLPNEEIFAKLARIGYEKRSTKLTFYKAFFSSQNKLVISQLIPQKYTSPALTQKVFTNMRQVGKGFFRVDTPLFEGMLVAQEVGEGDADENVEDVNDVGVIAEGDASIADDEVNTAVEEPIVPSPTPRTPPPQPSKDIPSTSQDKIAQALEITKLKQRVKKLERRNNVKILKLRRLQKVGTAQRIKTSNDTVMDDVFNQGRMIAEMDAYDDVVLEKAKNGRQAESQVEIYKIDLEHANKVLSMQEDESKPVKVQEVVDVVTTAKIITKVVTTASDTITAASTNITTIDAQVPASITTAAPRRRNKVVIRDSEESTTTSTIILAETKSKDKGKRILAKLNRNIDWDEVIDHVNKKAKEDPAVKRYQALKRKPQTEAQAKNMMIYLKNTKEQIDEEESRALKRINKTPAKKAAKRQKLDEEEIYNENNNPYCKIKRADDSHQLYLSFMSLLRNFDKEDLEALWRLVKERFATTKPKNFSDDFLLITLGAIFEKPDIHAQIWKNQRSVHGQEKVKS
nr:xylulose kinase-1 [Tanacetum cinerariifolium]